MDPDAQELSDSILFIQEDGRSGRVLFQETVDGLPGLFRVHAKNREAPGLKLAGNFLERRNLLPAVRSPRRPEMEKKHLPPEIAALHDLAREILQGKIGERHGFGVRLERVRPAPGTLGPGRFKPAEESGPDQSPQKKERPEPSRFHPPDAFRVFFIYSTGDDGAARICSALRAAGGALLLPGSALPARVSLIFFLTKKTRFARFT